ncbi:MAG: hypothetical protein KF824_07595 [Fimbriimonadaceae bacterium]|nr:MAG: hypothetical protein KF824_07595 [Fimbriimonadaceae bacterium]
MKLSPLAIFMLGLMALVIGVSYGVFQKWLPNMADKKAYDEWGQQLDTEGAKMNKAIERVELAQQTVKELSDKWQITVARRTPPASVAAGGINIAVNPYDLTVDSRTFRNNVQRAVNRQLKAGGVTVISGPQVPFPTDDPDTIMSSYYNYPNVPYPVVIFDLGQVTVSGTFEQISQNIRSWSNMPNYLAVADGLVITGTSPNMTGTYNLSVVGFVRGKKIAPSIQMAAGVPGGQPAAGTPGQPPAVPGARNPDER